jgi:hypothetical protein
MQLVAPPSAKFNHERLILIMPKIVEAWKLTNRNPDPNDTFTHFWIVRHEDGSGNMVNPDGLRLFLNTTRFDHEPEAYLSDTPYYHIHPVSPENLPPAA